jgi:transposase
MRYSSRRATSTAPAQTQPRAPRHAELVICDKTIERTQAWVIAFRKLATRHGRHAASVLAFLHLACVLICLRYLKHAEAHVA